MTAKFTPAPWVIANLTDIFTELGASTADGVECDSSDGWHIADCSMGGSFVGGELVDMGFDEHKANAHLIAAAPELYDMCQYLLDIFNHETRSVTALDSEKLEKLLAKARGES